MGGAGGGRTQEACVRRAGVQGCVVWVEHHGKRRTSRIWLGSWPVPVPLACCVWAGVHLRSPPARPRHAPGGLLVGSENAFIRANYPTERPCPLPDADCVPPLRLRPGSIATPCGTFTQTRLGPRRSCTANSTGTVYRLPGKLSC